MSLFWFRSYDVSAFSFCPTHLWHEGEVLEQNVITQTPFGIEKQVDLTYCTMVSLTRFLIGRKSQKRAILQFRHEGAILE